MLVLSTVDKTQREAVQRQRETSELQQQQLNSVSVAICHCHQDLLDAVDLNVVIKDFVDRSTIRMNCLEALEFYYLSSEE